MSSPSSISIPIPSNSSPSAAALSSTVSLTAAASFSSSIRSLIRSFPSISFTLLNRPIPLWIAIITGITSAATVGIIYRFLKLSRYSITQIEFEHSIQITRRLLNSLWNEYDINNQNWLECEEVRLLIEKFARQAKGSKFILSQYVESMIRRNNNQQQLNNNSNNNNQNQNNINNNSNNKSNSNNNINNSSSSSSSLSSNSTDRIRFEVSERLKELFFDIELNVIKIFPRILSHLDTMNYNNSNEFNINSNGNGNNKLNGNGNIDSLSASISSLQQSQQSIHNSIPNNSSISLSSSASSSSSSSSSAFQFDSSVVSLSSGTLKIPRAEFCSFFCMWLEHRIAQHLTLHLF